MSTRASQEAPFVEV